MAVVKKTLPTKKTIKKGLKAADTDATREFKLSTTVTEPSDNLQDYSILLFGEKKIGKTKMSSLFPSSYFIETEAGTKGVSHRGDPCTSWKLFRKMLRLLPKDPCRTVIVDTVDLAFKICFDHVCQRMGIDDPSEEDWGRGWRAIRDEFTQAMQELMSMDKGVILISHATEREIKRREGGKYHRIQPTMAGQARDVCEAIVDIWAYFHYDGTDRVMTIRGDEHISAGHRLDTRFRYQGKEIVQIHMGNTAEEGMKNFLDAFNNQYIPRPEDMAEPEPDEPAESKPVKKIKLKKAS